MGAGDRAPKVSVVTLTYNHERYVAQTLESVLGQKCDFDFEYLVGDDASTDGTAAILAEHAARHPGRLEVVLRDENVGAQRNAQDLFARCTGQYLAILDGDDFWTSEEKLQTQVDFMDAHPDCALCFHRAVPVDEDGAVIEGPLPAGVAERTTIDDLLEGNYISSCTVMYRWGLTPLPGWWNDTWIGDYPLHVLHAQHGWIGYIDRSMAAYRKNAGGLWTREHAVRRSEEFLKTLQRLDAEMGLAHHAKIQRTVYHYRLYAFGARKQPGGLSENTPSLGWLIRNLRTRGDLPLHEVVVEVVRGLCPALIAPLVSGKRVVRRLLGRDLAGHEDRDGGGPAA